MLLVDCGLGICFYAAWVSFVGCLMVDGGLCCFRKVVCDGVIWFVWCDIRVVCCTFRGGWCVGVGVVMVVYMVTLGLLIWMFSPCFTFRI